MENCYLFDIISSLATNNFGIESFTFNQRFSTPVPAPDNMKNSVLLALVCAASFPVAASGFEPGADFAVPHRLVDIGGRKLNLTCTGKGAPTVVFEAPSGSSSWTWWAVQPKVAAQTRACVYDRAGFGFSEPATHAADIASAVDDLHKLLQAAGERAPYVLVGNSLGGGIAEAYRWRYPLDVNGLVLVEPMHEEDTIRADAASQGKMSAADAQIIAFGDACGAQAEKGFASGSELYENCIGGLDPGLPKAVAAVDLKLRLSPAYWRVHNAEAHAFAEDRTQLRAARRPLGETPVIVLARGVSPYAVPGQPQSELNKAVEAANLELQKEVARSSTHGAVEVVAGAGHVIEETHPDAVVAAVEKMLATVRK